MRKPISISWKRTASRRIPPACCASARSATTSKSLIVVAPPRTLGALRKHYHKEVERRLIGEISKDLTGHPIGEIEKIIAAQ